MTLRSHIAHFLRIIFSPRLNLFNLVCWMLVIVGVGIGAGRGSVLIGLALGVAFGILFHGFFYALYVLTHRNEFVAEPGAVPNGGPARRSGDSGVGGGPPSVS